ncbi:hypothetical protein [Streptomyces ardesiacus]|uniref:hypothetical protein n=1 Tax=Streptomyces ardesiacus TaxID=285564 RepID=UPI003F4A0032
MTPRPRPQDDMTRCLRNSALPSPCTASPSPPSAWTIEGGGTYGVTLYVTGSAGDLRLYDYLTDPVVCELDEFTHDSGA